METGLIRKKLQKYIQKAESKKVLAIYTMIEHEIDQVEWDYKVEFKNELDDRLSYYLNGGKMVLKAEMNKKIKESLK